jgi:hypothetical protein
MVRGPGRDETNHPLVRALLEPVAHPVGQAYVLTNVPLESISQISFLTEDYVLETDYGDRFAALSALPKRFYVGYPRYLYRYDPEAAASSNSG